EQLYAGSYQALLTDSNGCSLTLDFDVYEPAILEIELALTHHIQNGELGNAMASISGGTPPYTIIWSSGEENTSEIYDLESGLYTITVVDFNGCSTQMEFQIDFL